MTEHSTGTARTIALSAAAAVCVGFAVTRVFGLLGLAPPEPIALTERVLGPADAGVAGAEVRPPAPFTEVAEDSGLDFAHDHDAHGAFRIVEQMGPGVGVLDYDGDGDLDVFVAGGGAIGEGPAQSCRLFRNDGGLSFTDVTERTGAGVPGPAYGVACADYDDDGDTDVFVTRLGPNALLRNDGNGRFEEVAATSGLADEAWGTGAAFLDYDIDGDLDLFVANYVDWSPAREPQCFSPLGGRDYCNPTTMPPTADRLYRNLGSGRFLDVSATSGVDSELGNGLGVLVSDFDGDGRPDVYVANDQTPAHLWHNNGDGTFSNIAVVAGCAYDGAGVAIAGMGVAAEDLDEDGDLDLLVTNIRDQSHLLLRNDGGRFADAGAAAGLARWSRPATGFGVALFDQDLDGACDLFVANGAVNRPARREHALDPYAEPDHFARWRDEAFGEAVAVAGPAESGRAVATGDLDGDGDLDVLVTSNGGRLRLHRNDQEGAGHWLIVDARTGTGPRPAIGARVEARVGDRTIVREVRPQQSYLSSLDPRVHFGLGGAAVVDELVVTWPDGTRTTRRDVAADRVLRIDRASP